MLERLRDALIDRRIRSKAAIHHTPLDRYRVRIARDVHQHEDAFRLLHVAYAFQGIENIRSDKLRITPQHVLPEATVFVAYEGEQCVGTMTVTLDSPAGIPVEKDYPEAIERLRNHGSTLVEYGSLAVVRRCWSTGVVVLLNIAATYWAIHMLEATDIVMGVNPKALPLYRSLYGFRPLGKPKQHAELTAPVAAMSLRIADGLAYTRKYWPKPMASGRTIAEHYAIELPECIEIPARLSSREVTRWKLPRSVFQELFINRSDRLDTLDPTTLAYLKRWRSDQTLQASENTKDFFIKGSPHATW